MLKLFDFCGCKSQISFIGDENARYVDRIAEVWRGSKRRRDGFAGLGLHPLPSL